ncbi:MAG: trigger factor [Chloroflexia bacterium]
MNVTREDMPGRQIALTIELDPETVNAALDRAYRQMVNQVNVPGFRRGRAPRYILESYVGKEMLTERAVRNILPDTMQDAIKAQDITAMDVSDYEIISMDPVKVKVIIVQPPKVELGDYSTIRVEKETKGITDSDIEEVLMELRREGAPWNEPAEPRPIKEGDMVYVNLEGFTTQGPIEAATRENFPTLVGVARAGIPEVVNAALAGMNVGDEKDITDTLPDDYPVEELRGLDATYHVTVLSMKEQELPEIDDEFAKKMSYDTGAELREAVERNLKRRAEETTESKQLDTIIEQLVASAEVDVPDVMVNEELDAMLKNLEARLKESRITTRQYFTYNGITEAEWREGSRERARERVIRTQVLSEFARREGISVDEDEVSGEINTILERFEGKEREDAEKVLGAHEARHDLEDRLFQQKIVERLIGIAEGRIEAAGPTDEGRKTEDEGGEELTDAEAGTASDLAEAGGAAEVLGTEGVDLGSENETGDAPGGGTPTTAPGVGGDDTKS